MKKEQILEGTVQTIKFPNKGIVSISEDSSEKRQCIVKHVLPGQRIRFAVQKFRSGSCEGRLLEVLERSPAEADSACRHFPACGGCAYQNLPYEEQLKLKEKQVRELLESALHDVSDVFEGIKPSPVQTGYRNKMEFSFGDSSKGGPLELGMHKRGSFYDIVTVTDCQIIDADYQKILTETLSCFREAGLSFYHKLTHTGYLRHLLVRKAARTGEILVDLITATQTSFDNGHAEQALLNDWQTRLLSLPLSGRLTGILHTRNDSVADMIRNDGTDILYGQDYFYEELLGLKFKISPFSFFQTNSLSAEVLYETARQYVSLAQSGVDLQGAVVYDLYSGTGTIAQLLAPAAGKVIGVEIVEEAVEAARENAVLNGLHNCEFIAGDVLQVLDEIEKKPDFIVLDPPRDGVHPKALKKIIRYGVEHIVYISCKPTSLVRDLETFLGNGYRVVRACAIDQFPGTVHVESVVLLTRINTEK
ncbi:MAG TPA: 23S rRNA (uracil(1939)-C(5))-methyltransferase RlmD [Lachnospiraceae bacterium]|nr:23S rRNA (uracil(1939)-C(5))-methyltransferase RlmD [Lachnospiraceae bacterium]